MGSSTKRLQYTYDVRGNRRSLTDADGGRFTYGYDSRSRITNVRNPQGDRTTFSYNAVSQRTVTRLSNGTRTSFSYDAAGNLTLLSNRKSDGSLISSFQYGYDKTGNRTSVLEGGGSRVTWSYDAGSQLAGEHRTGTTPYRNTFTYDAAGNRTLKNEGGARTTYSYDTANQLQWSQAAAGRTTYTFDADGNQQRVLAPDGSRTTTAWDYENRSTRVQLPSGIRNTMAYEPEGLRVKLEESAGTKKFVWDEQNYLAETDGANDTQVVYTNEPQFYGRLLSQRRGSTPSWYHYDGLGSTRELTDATQAVTDQKLYDAWGSVIQSSGSTVFPFQYVGNVGYYTDADQDTIYIRARTYQPSIARWWSVDILASLNRFVYVNGNPLLGIDASGLQETGTKPKQPFRVAITPLADDQIDGRSCKKNVAEIKWQFRPSVKIEGYIIQKVTISCSITKCEAKAKSPVAKFSYYEMWTVGLDEKGDITVIGEDPAVFPRVTDVGRAEATSGTYGHYAAEGEVRFFSKTVQTTMTLQAWKPDQRFPQGDKADKQCETTAGSLPASQTAPPWWETDPSNKQFSPANREISMEWFCCEGCDLNFANATAFPRFGKKQE